MKTKYILISAVMSIMGSPLLAQTKTNNYIGFSVGASMPMGDFSKSDPGTFENPNNTAGFAKTGLAVGIEGAWYFLPKLGLAGTLYFCNHGGFSKTDAEKLGDHYTDAFGVAESTVTTTGNYSSLNIMVGPQFSFPVNKLTIDVRLMGGLLKSFSTPQMKVALEDQSSFTQKSSTASAFGWQAGAGLRYTLTDKLGLMIKADYFSSAGVTIDNENRTNDAGRLVTKQPMSWVNASMGLVYSLGRK